MGFFSRRDGWIWGFGEYFFARDWKYSFFEHVLLLDNHSKVLWRIIKKKNFEIIEIIKNKNVICIFKF